MSDTITRDDDAPVGASKGDAAGEAAATMDADKASSVIGRAVTIAKPVAEVFAYFRDFSNLPHFMENVVSIDVSDGRRSYWVVRAPAGKTVEWDATVTDEANNQFIAWTSEPGADVPNSGRVEFRDVGERGTIVSATIAYDPPGGVIGKLVAKMFQREPAIQARRDLNRLKQLLETGEIATAAYTKKQFEEEGR